MGKSSNLHFLWKAGLKFLNLDILLENQIYLSLIVFHNMRGSRGIPLENLKTIGTLSILVPIPCKSTKLPVQHSWWADDGPLLVVFGSSFQTAAKKLKTKSEFDPH